MRESHDSTVRHVELLVVASLTAFAGLAACSSDGTSPNLAGGDSSAGGSATGGADATSGAGGAAADGGGGSAGAMAGGGTGGGGGGGEVPDETGTRQAAYYVSPSGSDDNPGTASAPFKTVTKARDAVRTVNADMTGDIYVYLRAGTYSLTDAIAFAPSDSGTNGHRIYYQAYPGKSPF